MTDEFTLRRAQKGDTAAFEQLVTPHEQTIWRVCWHYTHHQQDAADCMQEAMLKAWRAIGSYRGDCALESWLYRHRMPGLPAQAEASAGNRICRRNGRERLPPGG